MITTKTKIEIMQAHENGKDIEFRNKNAEIWKPIIEPEWDWVHNLYRIKPKPRYVPYDDVFDIAKDMWVRDVDNRKLCRIFELDSTDQTVRVGRRWFSLREFLDNFVYEDGTPCGKLEETT